MKSLLAISTLVFTLMFSSTTYAEWTELGTTTDGTTIYVDFERIRKNDGYFYFWNLSDYLKPSPYGDLSSKVYYQGDCKLFRMLRLSSSYYTQPMGEGTPSTVNNKQYGEWIYPSPNSAHEAILKTVCSR